MMLRVLRIPLMTGPPRCGNIGLLISYMGSRVFRGYCYTSAIHFQDSLYGDCESAGLTAPRVCTGSGVVGRPMAAIVPHYPWPAIGWRVGRVWLGLFTLWHGRGRDSRPTQCHVARVKRSVYRAV